MARTSQAPATAPKAPDFIAWHVSNRGDKAFWTKVGAAWFHRDRKGLSLQLEVVPINGRIVLRTPLDDERSEEHTSELQSLMRISYAVFCLKTKTQTHRHNTSTSNTTTRKVTVNVYYLHSS